MAFGSSQNRRLLSGTAIALAMGVATGTFAQDAETSTAPTTELETITVQGKTDRVAVSPLTQTTERAEIEERMVTDLQDFARRIDAGVNYNRNTNSINIRGLQDNRVLTTIDGIRLPWLTDPRDSARGGLNAFDFDTLSSVDITKGADSSKLGSGALGGAVELRTLNPEDLIAPGKNFGALMKGIYDSADRSAGGNVAGAARYDDTWILLQTGYKRGNETDNKGTIGGYGATRTEDNPADFDQRNLLLKVHQYVDGGHRFGITGELFNRDEDFDNMRGSTASYQPGSLKSGEEIDRKRLSASYDFISPGTDSWLDEAHIVTYWQREQLNNRTDGFRLRDGRSFIIPGDPFFYGYPTGVYKRDNQLEQTSYGITGNAAKSLELGGYEHNFRFGAELYAQRTTQYSAGVDNCPDVDWTLIPQPFGPQSCRMLHSNASDMPDVDSTFFGMYLEDDIKLMGDRLTITPGLRFDWFDHRPKSTAAYEDSPNYDEAYLASSSDSRFSPKLRAAWQATSEWELFAQWAQGFRAPSATELYQNYGAPGSYARVGNPDLKPETSNGFEIGTNYSSDTYKFSGTIFNNYYRNFIDTVQIAPPGGEYPVGGITGYENRAHVQIYGVELSGQWNFAENWRTWGSVAWSHGKDTDEDEYLNSVAPLRAILGLGYARETWGTDVSLTMASARNKVGDGGFRAPGYGIVDATAWWEPEQVKGLRVQAGIFNVFDKKYWEAVSVPDGIDPGIRDFYSEPGRSFRVAITQKF
ncbi:MAG: TonB-dependent hemoglobin/transferrin/lactoferrin family receptor [Shinella sp.]|nr:TonB-dependent hemoglobin/transferrin/lactoferrin family receptor [Shinella sp.]